MANSSFSPKGYLQVTCCYLLYLINNVLYYIEIVNRLATGDYVGGHWKGPENENCEIYIYVDVY